MCVLHKVESAMSDDAPPEPESLPQYLADGLPKQDDATLADAREYIEALLAYRRQPVAAEALPGDAEPVAEDEIELEGEAESGKGTLVEEYVTCGDETCACMAKDGEKHGPYLYRYYREGGDLTSEYVGKP